MSPIEDVMAAKPEDRLEVAMYYLEALTEPNDQHLDHYYFEYGLSRRKANFVHFMRVNCGKVCTYDKVWALFPDVSRDSLKTYICQIRKEVRPFFEIESVRADGWIMRPEEAEKIKPPPPFFAPDYPSRGARRWTRSETSDLDRMIKDRSTISDIAKALHRTEGAIIRRLASST